MLSSPRKYVMSPPSIPNGPSSLTQLNCIDHLTENFQPLYLPLKPHSPPPQSSITTTTKKRAFHDAVFTMVMTQTS